MAVVVPEAWMPEARMKRIIVHWTAGGYKANPIDIAHYHILIEESGKLVRGTHSIADNVNTSDRDYAAHVLGFNRGSIGVSMCCMHQCVEKPFGGGKFPMTERQWEVMLHVVAQLCQRYDIAVTPQTVLGHGEVHKNCGVRQLGKWDPMVLPWSTKLSPGEVGDLLRQEIQQILEPPVSVTVILLDNVFNEEDAMMQDGRTFVALREVEDRLGWTIKTAGDNEATVDVGAGATIKVPYLLYRSRGFVSSAELAEALDKNIFWDAATRTVTIR